MNKIRINELARELEVKAHEILDRLPGLGVTEKKTHSSSVDEDVAVKLRRIFAGGGAGADEEPEVRQAAPPVETPATVEPSPVPEVVLSAPVAPSPAPRAVEEVSPEPAAGQATMDRPAGRPTQPIRPPLAGTPSPGTPSSGTPPPSVPQPVRVAPMPAPPAAPIGPGR